MKTCVILARAETGTGALAWYNVPVVDLFKWADVVNEIEKTRKRNRKK